MLLWNGRANRAGNNEVLKQESFWIRKVGQCTTAGAGAEALTGFRAAPNINNTCLRAKSGMSTDNLKKLERRVDDLVGVCKKLKKENQNMKAGHDRLTDDHAKLMEKTQVARARIEAMIGRLKALERGS